VGRKTLLNSIQLTSVNKPLSNPKIGIGPQKKFPDMQQNSLTFQSKQNPLTFPDFPQSGNPELNSPRTYMFDFSCYKNQQNGIIL